MMDSKPTMITSKEFYDHNFSEKISNGDCVVMDGVLEVMNVVRIPKAKYGRYWDDYIVWYSTDYGNSTDYRDALPDDKFYVKWIPPVNTPPPDAAQPTATFNAHMAEEHAEMCGHLSDICEALGIHNQNGNQIVKEVRKQASELATLRAELAAAKAERDVLKKVVQVAKDQLDTVWSKNDAAQVIRDFRYITETLNYVDDTLVSALGNGALTHD